MDTSLRPARKRPPKLFAFHHAGGSATAFTGWQRALGSQIEVVPVPLPGRDPSGRSPRYRDLTSLAEALQEELGPQLTAGHLFYGHSMGALVAYHLTRLRVAAGLAPPRRLLVGAFPAPHLPHLLERVLRFTDEQLARWLLDLTGMPEQLLEGPHRRERQVALLRGDLRLCASHRPERYTDPLPCPIDVMAGARDPLVTVAEAAAWSRHSGPGSTLRVIPGGHFFPRETKDTFFAELASVVRLAHSR